MTITEKEMLDIVSKKIDQLEKLYDLASRKEGYTGDDIHLLLRFTMSLEKQVRQLQYDVKWLSDSKAGPRPEVIGARRANLEKDK